jgi:hypothetical protein
MWTTRIALVGALSLFAVASLTGCANDKIVTRTEAVTVERDRYVPFELELVEQEIVPPYIGAVIRNRQLEEHDRAASEALARANAKLAALGCLGKSGADGTTALSCITSWWATRDLHPRPPLK